MSSATTPASIPRQPGGPVLGGPVLGGPVLGGPVLGGPALGGPALGGPALGDDARGDDGPGSTGRARVGAAGVGQAGVGAGSSTGAEAFPVELSSQPVQGPPVPPEWYHYYAQQRPPDRLTRLAYRLGSRSPVWVAPVAMLACMGGAIGYTLVSHPEQADAGAAPTCLLKLTTGFCCPGCGGTRAAWYLLHGNIPAAARHHALFTFAVPFLLYMYVAWAGRRLFNWKLPQLTISPRVMIGFLTVWGVWSVLRNLPWAPFTAFYV